jgi:hypothetical protein
MVETLTSERKREDMKFRLTDPDALATRRRQLGMTVKDVVELSRVDYGKILDLERAKYKRLDALLLEAVCYALGIHPMHVSDAYEPPAIPRLSYVAVDGRRVAEAMRRKARRP